MTEANNYKEIVYAVRLGFCQDDFFYMRCKLQQSDNKYAKDLTNDGAVLGFTDLGLYTHLTVKEWYHIRDFSFPHLHIIIRELKIFQNEERAISLIERLNEASNELQSYNTKKPK